MAETLFLLYPGEHFLVMDHDGSVQRYRAQGWGIEQMDPTGQFVIGDEERRWLSEQEEAGSPRRGDDDREAPADR